MSEWVLQTGWPWLVDVSLKGALILACVWLLYRLLPRQTALLRNGAMFSVFTGLAMLLCFAAFMGEPSHRMLLAAPAPTVPVIVDAAPIPAPAWPVWLFGIWLMGCLGSFFQTVRGLWLLRRIRAQATPVTDPKILAQMNEFALVRKWHRLPAPILLQARTPNLPAVPMTWGIRHPVILLPQDADTWEAGRLRAVLLHEFWHIAAGDWLNLIGRSLVRSFFWYLPLAWWAERQARLESEQAADHLAVSAGIVPAEYADHLIAIARACRPSRAWDAAVPMARPSHLRQRVTALLEQERDTKRPKAIVMALLSLCYFAVFYTAASAMMVRLIVPVGGPDARIRLDAKTAAVMGQTIAATESLHSLSADLQETTTVQGQATVWTQTAHAALARPNLARIDSPQDTFAASGGETWLVPTDSGRSYHFRIAPDGRDMTADDLSQPLVQFFFHPDYYRLGGYLVEQDALAPVQGVAPGPIPVEGRYLGVQTWRGIRYDVVEFTRQFIFRSITTVYIGPDHLVHRIVSKAFFDNTVRTDDLALTHLQRNPALPRSLFVRPANFSEKGERS